MTATTTTNTSTMITTNATIAMTTNATSTSTTNTTARTGVAVALRSSSSLPMVIVVAVAFLSFCCCLAALACCSVIKFKNVFAEFFGRQFQFARPRGNPSPASKAADYDVEAASDSKIVRQPTGSLLGMLSINGSTKGEVMANQVDVCAETSKAAEGDVETGSVSRIPQEYSDIRLSIDGLKLGEDSI